MHVNLASETYVSHSLLVPIVLSGGHVLLCFPMMNLGFRPRAAAPREKRPKRAGADSGFREGVLPVHNRFLSIRAPAPVLLPWHPQWAPSAAEVLQVVRPAGSSHTHTPFPGILITWDLPVDEGAAVGLDDAPQDRLLGTTLSDALQ